MAVEIVSSPAEPVIKEGSGLTKRKSHVIDSNTTNSNEYCNIETANKKARRSSSSQTKLSSSSPSPSPAQGKSKLLRTRKHGLWDLVFITSISLFHNLCRNSDAG